MNENNCTFCRIVKGEIESKKELETDNLFVFHDIHPKAPTHILIIPKTHIADVRGATMELWEEIRQTAINLSEKYSLSGFRLVTNAGTSALVKHFHVHLLGGLSDDAQIEKGL